MPKPASTDRPRALVRGFRPGPRKTPGGWVQGPPWGRVINPRLFYRGPEKEPRSSRNPCPHLLCQGEVDPSAHILGWHQGPGRNPSPAMDGPHGAVLGPPVPGSMDRLPAVLPSFCRILAPPLPLRQAGLAGLLFEALAAPGLVWGEIGRAFGAAAFQGQFRSPVRSGSMVIHSSICGAAWMGPIGSFFRAPRIS